jgi:hypothetical protein
VYLDENRIDFGTLDTPAPLPPSRQKKLLQAIASAAPVFARRESDWKEMRLPTFDVAFSSTSERVLTEKGRGRMPDAAENRNKIGTGTGDIDEVAIRAAFLNFFASVLKVYRRHLVYGSTSDPDPIVKFNCEAFLAGTVTVGRPCR